MPGKSNPTFAALTATLCSLGLAIATLPLTASGAEEAATPATWQAHELKFVFMGFTSTYSCDGLGDSLKVLLQESGARAGLKVDPLCTQGFGHPEKLAEARLRFEALQPLSAGTAPADGSAPVAGTWRHVEFSWHQPHRLQPNDCELVEQFADKVLPLFATRNVQRNITCVPNQDSRLTFNLQFDVLAPAPGPRPSP